jgi:4'-phosphopantetheinyl transferase
LTRWARPPARPEAKKNEVHLWLASLEAGHVDPEGILGILSEEEGARAGRFRFRPDRDRFLLGRATLRSVLGRYLRKSPAHISFSLGPQGKPRLTEGDGALQFNFSHSGKWALLAVASERSVGVDIERIDPDRATDEIAGRFFAPDEVAALRGIPPAGRVGAFFRCWTRKEAYIKARGEGLWIPLQTFSVPIGPAIGRRLLRSDLGEAEIARWELADLRAVPGYAAALVAEGTGWKPRFWRCPPDLAGLS